MNDDATLHLEYLYGPQWRTVVAIVERAGQLTAEEREKLNAAAARQAESTLKNFEAVGSSGGSGLAGLLSGLGRGLGGLGQGLGGSATNPAQIAQKCAKEFGRTRNVQIAAAVAGQAMSGGAGTGEINALFQSLGSIGAIAVVGQAVTAAALSDLVGNGEFTQAVFDELTQPWQEALAG